VEENFEEQQVQAVKDWWKKYRYSILGGLIAGALLVTAYNYWKDYKNNRAEEASALYENFSRFANSGAQAQMKAIGQQLMDDYSATPYAELAALMMAKHSYENGDLDAATSQLSWAMDNAEIAEVEHIARTRLARVLIDKGDYVAALKLVEGREAGPYTPWYLEIKGDIYIAQGDEDAAKQAYREALSYQDLKNNNQSLQMKLDNLGVADEN
jgi:predicted negative regulator of RcsB-dependent stress response